MQRHRLGKRSHRTRPNGMKLFTLTWLLLAIAPLRSATACKCLMDLRTPLPDSSEAIRSEFDDSDVVFVGTVSGHPHRLVRWWRTLRYALLTRGDREPSVDREHEVYDRRVRLRVGETLKGAPGRTVTILTGWGGGDCGYPFDDQIDYLVFAHQTDRGRLYTTICDRTSELANAADELRVLRSLYRQTHAGAPATRRLTPRCSGQHPGVRPGVAAELKHR